MKKDELIKHLAEQTGNTQKAVKDIFAALDATLQANAAAGEDTVLGLLTVTTVKKEARTGRNPITGAAVEIPAKSAIKIKVSKPLKVAANGAVK